MFTSQQLDQFTEELSERIEFRAVYAKMLQYNVGTTKFLREEAKVKEYISEYLKPELFFVEPTEGEVSQVYESYSTTYALDFVYELLPEYVKECLDPEKVIRELFRVYTEERNIFTRFIKQLASLQDPFEAPEEFLEYLAETIGLKLPYDIPEESKRVLINRAVPWYKIKGTAQSFQIVFRSLGLGADVVELWSNYEQTRFSPTPEQSPVIDGADNPDYDPTVTDDGIIKYKSSFYELSMYPSAVNLTSNIISRALEKLEEVRPATRTLKQIKFSMNLTDDADDGDGPGGDGGEGVGSGNGFPTPEDEFENCGDLSLSDDFELTSTLVTYGGTGPAILTYGVYDVTYGTSGSQHLYNRSLEDAEVDYYYDQGHINFYDGEVSYDNATNILYAPEIQGLTYAGYGSTIDELEIINFVDVEDRLRGVKIKYDNIPSAGAITYDGSDPSFTYNGSEVADELEIFGSLENDFQDSTTFSDEADYVVTTGDESDKAYTFLSYDGTIYYDNQHTYTYNEENEYLLDELEYQPTGELEDTVPLADYMDVMIDLLDVVPDISDETEEVVYIADSDEFIETITYNGQDVDGSPLTYGVGFISYNTRTYSDTISINMDLGELQDSVAFTDTVDFSYEVNDSIVISDEFGIYHVQDSLDSYRSGLTYNGAIDYYGNILNPDLVPFTAGEGSIGNWDQGHFYANDDNITYDEATPPSYGEEPLVFDDNAMYGDFFSYGEINIPFLDDLEQEQGNEDTLEDSVALSDGFESDMQSELSDSVSSTDVCDIVYGQDATDGFLNAEDFDGARNTYSNPHGITYSEVEIFYNAEMPSPESDAGYFDGSIVYYNGRTLLYDAENTYYDGYAHADENVVTLLENDVVDFAEIEIIPTGNLSGTIIKI
jgi:hypothetical protein